MKIVVLRHAPSHVSMLTLRVVREDEHGCLVQSDEEQDGLPLYLGWHKKEDLIYAGDC